ncbi:hypothetical protein [Mucilaginibacter sp. SG564]|uniref:hypothetical protein n=1 Tax=Mucilaginibacter sp. SG564 TaxID=2587022 RepID=UPI001552EDBD|nr:hypothetical protein [Mucilaginibacter sp. SG564]NOW94012.1 hypothetical protein [Mucilaginibacter sp. SG564]
MSNSENFNIEEYDDYAKKLGEKIERKEEKGIEETIKYFDRIHDKLFSVNSILIGGYLALIAFKHDVPRTILFIPMLNFFLLILIDYRLMEKSRSESNYGKFTSDSIDKYGKHIHKTNLLSFLSILLTIVETLFFTYYVS